MKLTHDIHAGRWPEAVGADATHAVASLLVVRRSSLMTILADDLAVSGRTGVGDEVSTRIEVDASYPATPPRVASYAGHGVAGTERPLHDASRHGAMLVLDIVATASSPDVDINSASCEFARRVSDLADVKAVSVATEADIVRVWTFILRRDKALRERIYPIELGLMRDYSALRFDFNVVALDGLGDGEFLPSDSRGRLIFYRS